MKVHNYNTRIRFSCYFCHCFALYTSSFLHNLVLTAMHLFSIISLSAPGGIVNLSADSAATMATLSWDRLAEIEIKARFFNSYFVTLTIIRLLTKDNNQEVCLNESSAMRYQNFTRHRVENTSLLAVNLGKPSCHMLTYFTSNNFYPLQCPTLSTIILLWQRQVLVEDITFHHCHSALCKQARTLLVHYESRPKVVICRHDM